MEIFLYFKSKIPIMVSLHFGEFLKHHGAKGLKDDVKNAMAQVAAEYSYAETLRDHLKGIEETAPWEKKDKKAMKKAFRILRWISRGERKADKYEKKVIGDLKEFGKHLSSRLKGKEEEILAKLEVAEKKILVQASFYQGQLRKDLNSIQTEEQLLEKLGEDENLKKEIVAFWRKIKADVNELIIWLSSIEEILRGAAELEQKATRDSFLEGFGIKEVPPLAKLYKAYGYEAPKNEPSSVKKLNIKWTKKLQEEVAAKANEILDWDPEKEGDKKTAPTREVIVNENAVLKIQMAKSVEDYLIFLEIILQTANGKQIADFRCKRDEFWVISHRLVEKEYQGQGIGTQMILLLESCLRQYAKSKGARQTIFIETSQIPVALFVVKNSYLPMTRKDAGKLRMLLSVNEDLFLVTGKGYASEGGSLPGFIFSKKHIRESAEEEDKRFSEKDLVNNDFILSLFYHDNEVYMANGFKIRFVKILK